MIDNYTHIYDGEDAVEPKFKAGEVRLFDYPTVYSSDDYMLHTGQMVEIVRALEYPKEYENMGDPMYRIRASDGWEGDAWESELSS
jgi:hypothetical protein